MWKFNIVDLLNSTQIGYMFFHFFVHELNIGRYDEQSLL